MFTSPGHIKDKKLTFPLIRILAKVRQLYIANWEDADSVVVSL